MAGEGGGYEIEGEVGGGGLIKSPFGLRGVLSMGFFQFLNNYKKNGNY